MDQVYTNNFRISKVKRIAVIGAGPCGLPAIKCCIEEGFDVVCLEKTGNIGGLWRYHEEDVEGVPSVMKSTVINTSKELSSYSDFPPPREFPNFLPNHLMLKYFEMYSEHFKLREHIKFHKQVITITKSEDYETTGKWCILMKDAKTGEEELEIFDGVMVCTGHHTHPRLPHFRDQEKFKGKIMHTHSLKTVDEFKKMRVLVVGVGNSGLDAASEISTVAQQVYLSTRRGCWISSKIVEGGLPADGMHNNRLHNMIFQMIGWKQYSILTEKLVNNMFDHSLYGLKPQHHIFSQHISLNDSVLTRIAYGQIAVKKDVVRFIENGVFFEGDEMPTELDAVILATGYNVSFPFLPKDVVDVHENKVSSLFKLCFPAQLSHPSLAIIALAQAIGCIFPIAENQSRWFVQLMAGKAKLPTRQAMLTDIQDYQKEIAKRYVDSPRHTLEVDYVPYMDDIASQYGAKPNLLKYVFSDIKLFWALLLYPCMSYQYRLTGPKPWTKARKTILTYPDRVSFPLNGGKVKMSENFFHPSAFGLRIWKQLLILTFVGTVIVFISVIVIIALSF